MWSSKNERPQIIRNYHWSIISSFNKVLACFIFRASIYHGVWLHSFQIQIQIQIPHSFVAWCFSWSSGTATNAFTKNSLTNWSKLWAYHSYYIFQDLHNAQSFFWGISSLAICMAQELLPQPKFMLNVLPDIQLEIISLNFRSGSTLYKLPVLVLCPAQQAVHIFTSH